MAGAASFLDLFLRILVLAAALGAGAVALTHWAVRARHLPPFGPVATTVRRLSDPALRPIERTLVRGGRSPQEAPLWLLGLAIVAGIVLLSVSRWVVAVLYQLAALRGAPPRVWAEVGAALVLDLLMLALVVRVVGSWVGSGRYGRLTRPAWLVTDWLVEPIRRRLPAFGPVDLSPIVAYLLLALARGLVLGLL